MTLGVHLRIPRADHGMSHEDKGDDAIVLIKKSFIPRYLAVCRRTPYICI